MTKKARKSGPKEVRLTGGDFGRRRLRGGPGIRPTPAIVREALFQILGDAIHDTRVLDLCSGTGSIGFESLGRGAKDVVAVDAARTSIAALRENAQTLGVADRVRTILGDARKVLKSGRLGDDRFGFVFLGPPYDRDLCLPILERIESRNLDGPEAIVLVQASPREKLPETAGVLTRYRLTSYGDSILHFYRLAEEEKPPADA